MNAAQGIYGEGWLKAELGVAANASPQDWSARLFVYRFRLLFKSLQGGRKPDSSCAT